MGGELLTADLVIRPKGVITSTAVTPNVGVAAAAGRIVAIAENDRLPAAKELIELPDAWIMPGIIDTHVHFREPGMTQKEDFLTGSYAAAMGGVTTVLDMPNTAPPTDRPSHLREKERLAAGRFYVDYGFYGLLWRDNLDQLAELARAGVVGFKCFLIEETIGSQISVPPPSDGQLLDAMETIAKTELRLGFHAENAGIVDYLSHRIQASQRHDHSAHRDSRPPIAEAEAIQRVGLFAAATGVRVHIFHLSSSDGLTEIERWRARQVEMTCETAAQYCFLDERTIAKAGPVARVNPPIREASDRSGLLNGLARGKVDLIASDHAPHTDEEKSGDSIWKVISGIGGVEISLALFLTYGVHGGILSLPQLVKLMSVQPARVWSLWPQKGNFAIGADADLTAVNLDEQWTVGRAALHGKSNATPFEGQVLKGRPVATIVRGRVVMLNARILTEPIGQIVRSAQR